MSGSKDSIFLFSGGDVLARFHTSTSPPEKMTIVLDAGLTDFPTLVAQLDKHMEWWGKKAQENLTRGLSFSRLMAR